MSNPFQYLPSYRPPGSTPINPGSVGGFSGGPQYASPFGGGHPPVMGGPMGGSLGGALLGRLGLGGLPGVADSFAPPAAGAAPQGGQQQPSGWGNAFGGVGNWIDGHRGALSDIGKVAGGAINAYGMYSQVQAEKHAQRRAQEEADRKRRDQEASAQAVAPGYAALLQALSQRMGYGQGGG